jgi:DNA repair protein RecO (recombination protein O)
LKTIYGTNLKKRAVLRFTWIIGIAITKGVILATSKVSGLVIKETFFGESDKVIDVALFEKGRMSFYCKGGRSHKSKFMAGTQLFTYSEFVYLEGIDKNNKKFNSLCSVEIIESFYKLRTDFDTLCHAAYYLELLEKTTLEAEAFDQTLINTLKSFRALIEGCEPLLVTVAFELGYLANGGLTPETDVCSVCGHDMNHDEQMKYLDSGLVCNPCAVKTSMPYRNVTKQENDAIRFMLSNQSDEILKYTVDKELLRKLKLHTEMLITSHFQCRFKSLEICG